MNRNKRSIVRTGIVILTGVYLTGCANLAQILNQMDVQKPVVTMKSVDLTALSLETADLQFTLEINNPNSFGINLAGFDYQLDINQHPFLNGDQPDKIEIGGRNSSLLDVPVTINYIRLFDAVRDLLENKKADYKVDFGFKFDLPVLGNTRIPVSHSGSIPVPKIPELSVSSLKVKNIGLTGADLELIIKIENPNIFGFDLNDLNYNFSVNGNRWIQGRESVIGDIGPGGQSLMSIPISLNFLQIGRSVADLISGGDELNYLLTGNVDVSGKEIPLQIKGLNFNRDGKINLEK